jgi:hypothetical protein
VIDGDVPLSAGQIEALSAAVLARVQQHQREQQRQRDSMLVRRSVIPPRETRG